MTATGGEERVAFERNRRVGEILRAEVSVKHASDAGSCMKSSSSEDFLEALEVTLCDSHTERHIEGRENI